MRAALVPLIIILNIAVFVGWSVGVGGGIDGPEFMQRNFTVSWDLVAEGRYWTLLTAVFSHTRLWHILLNMFVLRSFGSLLEQVLGSWRFFKFYFAAGICGSLVHILVSRFVLNEPEMGAVGASGAIAGLVLVFALLFPREKILLFAIIPVPALFGALGLMGLDIWGLVSQAEGGGLPIGHGAHLGGAFAGILYYFFSLRKRRYYL